MNAVVELRQRLGISQEEASLLLGISRGHLSKIEIGQSPPKGLSEVYLFQAIRLLDQMEEPPFPEIVSSEPPEFVRKERERLTLRKLKLDQQKATLSKKIKQVLCLKAFIPLLQNTPNVEDRNLGPLLNRFNRLVAAKEENLSTEYAARLDELRYIEGQLQCLDALFGAS